MVNEAGLERLYFAAREMPGWIAVINDSSPLSKEEIEYLESLDEIYGRAETGAHLAFRDIADVVEAGVFALSPDEAIGVLTGKIAQVYLRYQEMAEADRPYRERAAMLEASGLKTWERLRRSLRAKAVHTSDKRLASEDSLTDHEIAMARAVPLEKIVPDLNKAGYTKCRWHNDSRPSMLVKGGFGYCFSCTAWADSIKWLCEVDGLAFRDAVKELSRL